MSASRAPSGPALPARVLAASLRLPGTGERLPELLLEIARHGSTPMVRLGRSRALLLTDPADVAQVLVRGGRGGYEKPGRMTGRGLRGIAGEGILTSRLDEAIERRTLVAPCLRADAGAGFEEIAREAAERQAAAWLRAGRLDLFRDLTAMARRLVAETVLGPGWRSSAPGLERELEHRRRLMSRGLRARIEPRRPRPPRALEREIEACVASIRPRETPRGIAAALLAAGAEEDLVVEESRTLLLNGYETVALAAGWTLHELARSPEDAITVRAARGNADDPAVGAAVDESLRLHPPVPRFHRVAQREDELPTGARVSRGRLIVISPYVLGRLDRLWPRPESFIPARFDPARARHDKYAFIPFGAGPRVCIARRLALVQIREIVATISARLDLRPLAPIALDPGTERRNQSCRAEARPA